MRRYTSLAAFGRLVQFYLETLEPERGDEDVPSPGCKLGEKKLDAVVEFRGFRTTTFANSASDRNSKQKTMKYICLGYYNEQQFQTWSEEKRNVMLDNCFNYDDLLRKNGHFAGGEALQSARNAATLRWKKGKVSITDGPYAETKEQLGGILFLEARDLKHAIRLMSKHPGVKNGPFEIRPAADLTQAIRESEQRRAKAKRKGRRSSSK